MKRTLIQKDSSSLVEGMLERINGLSSLNHKLTEGELKELFVSKILRQFLSIQFDTGTGIIVNQRGDQSRQTDIVIYDNRIIPPFIKEQAIGVYPAESVIAVLEVKSRLGKQELLAAETSATELYNSVYDPEGFLPGYSPEYKPLCGIIGFDGNGCKELSYQEKGTIWLKENIKHLFLICITNKYCWGNVPTWSFQQADNETHEETKKFIALLLDNIRTRSEEMYHKLMDNKHRDFFSIYLRDQKTIRDYFEKKS
ncbi:MAG: hypothetical protein JXJ04_07260 [Spirochaetales bacterium]|nr:hypothetical protein [Spirochaetales bacterium]